MGSMEETPLAAACSRGSKRIAEFLIQCGANVNYKCSVSIAIKLHVTSWIFLFNLEQGTVPPIGFAIICRQLHIVRFLVKVDELDRTLDGVSSVWLDCTYLPTLHIIFTCRTYLPAARAHHHRCRSLQHGCSENPAEWNRRSCKQLQMVNSLGPIADISAKSHAYYRTIYYGFSLSSDGRAWTSTTPGDLLVSPLCITTESRAPSVLAGSCYGQKQVRHCKSIER